MPHKIDLPRLSAEIDQLVRRVEGIADPQVRETVLSLLQSVMNLHAEGLRRIIGIVLREEETGSRILANVGADEVVGGLLLLHDLHPDASEIRISKAIDRISKTLSPHGVRAEFAGKEGSIARLRLLGTIDGCMSSLATIQRTVEEAVYEAAPEILAIEIENHIVGPSSTGPLVQLELKSTITSVSIT